MWRGSDPLIFLRIYSPRLRSPHCSSPHPSPPYANLLPLTPLPNISNLATDTNKMATKTDDDFKTWEEATTALGHTKVWNICQKCEIQTGYLLHYRIWD